MSTKNPNLEKDDELIYYCLACNVSFETEKDSKEHKKLLDCDPVRIAMRDVAFVKKNITKMRIASDY